MHVLILVLTLFGNPSKPQIVPSKEYAAIEIYKVAKENNTEVEAALYEIDPANFSISQVQIPEISFKPMENVDESK